MIVKQHSTIYSTKIYGRGITSSLNGGLFIQHGDGIFTDNMKVIGKHALSGLSNLWNNFLKPRLIAGAKEGFKLGSEVIQEKGPELGKVIQNAIKDRSLNKEKLKEIGDSTKNKLNDRSQDILNKLLYGEGLKFLPISN